jgi:VanZ family protein
MNSRYRHIKVAAIAIAIMVLSLGNPGETGRTVFRFFNNADKLVHAAMYFVLTFVIIYQYRREATKNWVLILLATLAFSYSVLMEILQMTVTTNRKFEGYDILANFTGVILGVTLFLLLRRLMPERFRIQ